MNVVPRFPLHALPYHESALEPVIATTAVRRHHGLNEATYAKKLNELAPVGQSLPQILQTAPIGSPLYNNAAQYWIHYFWWHSLIPKGKKPSQRLAAALGLTRDWFTQWVTIGSSHFGSGWLWLVWHPKNGFNVYTLSDAKLPTREKNDVPLLVIDLWEHAYYAQYGVDRKTYIEAVTTLIDWRIVEARWDAAQTQFRL